jgi:hypothetical protein
LCCLHVCVRVYVYVCREKESSVIFSVFSLC